MIYHITRGCSDAKTEKQRCKEGTTDLAQSKKCNFACNYDGCNNGLSEVSARFNDGTVTECYACEYIEGKDSTISGAPYCGVSIESNNTRVPIKTCPTYANRACYQASALHEQDFSSSNFVDF